MAIVSRGRRQDLTIRLLSSALEVDSAVVALTDVERFARRHGLHVEADLFRTARQRMDELRDRLVRMADRLSPGAQPGGAGFGPAAGDRAV